MSTGRQELMGELDWPWMFKRANVKAARQSLGPAFAVLRAFGWVSHPEQRGWFRWTVFDRQGECAIAEAYADSPALILRVPGDPSNFIYNRAYLLAGAVGSARKGFGTMPCTDELLAIATWLVLDASGHGGDADLALASLFLFGRGVSAEVGQL